MKRLLPFAFSSALILGSLSSANAQSPQIVIKGEVVNSTDKVKNYHVNVYQNGKITESLDMSKNIFNYSIPTDSEVMLEIIADGHFAKRIAFDSKLGDDVKKVPRFDITMNLIEKSDNKNYSDIQDLLDMPSAFITYSNDREFFDKNLQYSKVIKKGIKDQLASK